MRDVTFQQWSVESSVVKTSCSPPKSSNNLIVLSIDDAQVLGGLYVVARVTSIFSLLTLAYLGNEAS